MTYVLLCPNWEGIWEVCVPYIFVLLLFLFVWEFDFVLHQGSL